MDKIMKKPFMHPKLGTALMTPYAYSLPRRMARPWVVAGHLLPISVRDEDEAFILTALVPASGPTT